MQLHVIYVENYPGLPWWISPLAHLFWGGSFFFLSWVSFRFSVLIFSWVFFAIRTRGLQV